jgi:8-oxo-dGTP pyrophosphatase MutT (NUDIX family)
VWFRLVTRDIDRHGTIIEPAGVDMTAFRANPVFLWMHDSGGGEVTPPPDVVIGRVVNFEQSVDALDIEVEFDDDGDGLAATCFRKVKDGFLRMVSIGCNVLEEETVQIGTHKVPVYTRTELLECSLVIIGSNRGALKLDRSRVAAMLREVGGVGGVVKAAEAAPPAAPAPATVPQRRSLDDKQVSTVAVIAPGHMLWGKRRDDGKWTTPGGHLHPGESPVDGAVRELAEESGIIVTADKLKPLGAVTNAKGVRIHTFRLDVPKMISPTTKRDPDKEIEVWEWVPFESGRLPQHILSNLHAQPNAIVAALRLDRAVMGAGGPAVDTLLTTTVYGGDGMDFFGDDDDMLKVRDEDGEEAVSPLPSSPPSSSTSSTSLLSDSSSTSTPETTTSRFATRGVVAHTNYPTVTTAWDASAAVDRWKKWASSDGSGDKEKIDWAKFAKCFLWFDDRAPESFGSYAFPHHDIVDGKPVTVWAGVVAAAARIDQSKGIPAGDIAKMKAHLAEHYKEFDKVAPWQRAAYDMPGGLQRVWQLSTEAAQKAVNADAHANETKQPEAEGLNIPTPQIAIGAETGTLLVEAGDVYKLVGVVPHALLFPSSAWTKDDAALWAQKHGYAYFTAYPKDGMIELVVLNADVFRRNAFGVGVKFKTFRVQSDPEVSLVVGVLKLKGERALVGKATGRKAERQADRLLRSLVNLKLSPSASAEIAYGIKRSARLIVDAATVKRAERVHRGQSWTFRALQRALSTDAVTRTLYGDFVGQREARRILDEAVARLRQLKALRYTLS